MKTIEELFEGTPPEQHGCFTDLSKLTTPELLSEYRKFGFDLDDFTLDHPILDKVFKKTLREMMK